MASVNPVERSCLLIADSFGYTAYLVGVELDHAEDIVLGNWHRLDGPLDVGVEVPDSLGWGSDLDRRAEVAHQLAGSRDEASSGPGERESTGSGDGEFTAGLRFFRRGARSSWPERSGKTYSAHGS